MSLDICSCNICPNDVQVTLVELTICQELLIRSWQQDSPNIVRIWRINTLQLIPGHNCPCNICSCNICPGDICPGDICPGNICPSSDFSGTADQILVKLWISSSNGLGNNWPGYIHPGNFWPCQKYPFNNHPFNNWNKYDHLPSKILTF